MNRLLVQHLSRRLTIVVVATALVSGGAIRAEDCECGHRSFLGFLKRKHCDSWPGVEMAPSPSAMAPQQPAPQAAQPMPQAAEQPSSLDLASATETAGGPQSIAPGVLGDLGPHLGNPFYVAGFTRFKVADGQSPLPQCRVSF